MDHTFTELQQTAKQIRKMTLQCIGELGVGHIGGSLSLCELLAVLYFKACLLYTSPSPRDRG